jgi:hypothetical protein
MILKNNKAFFSKEKAIEVAAEYNKTDEDWTYTAVHCPNGTGYSFVEIHDEDGEFVAFVDSALI